MWICGLAFAKAAMRGERRNVLRDGNGELVGWLDK